jgi:hypothetical protein
MSARENNNGLLFQEDMSKNFFKIKIKNKKVNVLSKKAQSQRTVKIKISEKS